MDYYNDLAFCRSLIVNHATYPSNLLKEDDQTIQDYKHQAKTLTASCADNLTVIMKIDKNMVIDAKFFGNGCAISTASVDMLLNNIKNKDISTVTKLVDDYLELIQSGKIQDAELLNDLVVFRNVYKQASRITCAQSGALSVKKIIGEYNENH